MSFSSALQVVRKGFMHSTQSSVMEKSKVWLGEKADC